MGGKDRGLRRGRRGRGSNSGSAPLNPQFTAPPRPRLCDLRPTLSPLWATVPPGELGKNKWSVFSRSFMKMR